MRLELLKSLARSLLRTANRRLTQYREKGLKNPDIEDILEKIKYRPYFNEKKGTLKTGGLDKSELIELIDVQRSLRRSETPGQYVKNIREIYNNSGVNAKVDPNLFYRAIKRFEQVHGTYYREWTNYIERTGKIESKGDTLALWFKEILNEQIQKEYSPQEVDFITKGSGFKDF